jgi:alanyl-tRNA synthetase
VDLIETSFEEWVKLWAKALLEEKYGDEVRVIRVHDWDTNI